MLWGHEVNYQGRAGLLRGERGADVHWGRHVWETEHGIARQRVEIVTSLIIRVSVPLDLFRQTP